MPLLFTFYSGLSIPQLVNRVSAFTLFSIESDRLQKKSMPVKFSSESIDTH